MEKCVLLLLVFFATNAISQDLSRWCNIDCGAATSYQSASGILWETDDEYIKTGTNKQVSFNSSYPNLELLNSLRVFTQQNKNCYTVPTREATRYFIRATFHYGNYDGLSKPPTFDLEIDGNKWTTVESSLNEPIYFEVIYPSSGGKREVAVCLAQTKANQFPFISSLEVWPILNTMYTSMSRGIAWLMSYRYNYGTNDTILGYPVDRYNRIWEPSIPSGLVTRVANTTVWYWTIVEYPPDSAMFDAVESQGPSDSIILPFSINKTNSLTYIEAYFTEMELLVNETRSFDLYVDNDYKTISPEYQNFTGESTTIKLQGGTLTVELRPTTESTLPPIISAIEVYTASDPLVTTGTSQDDLDGLAVFISTFDQLGGWSGEPCLPSDTTWQWLGCTGSDTPRVTSLKLSGYGLEGPLPDFSQMQALESIDLSNNKLNGLIPNFLGNLTNLKLLNLNSNDFSGNLPYSIVSNKKIKYNVKGNPRLNYPHKGKRTAMIIGLAVGVPLATIILILVLVYFLIRKQQMANQEQPATAPELGGPQMENGSDREKPQEAESASISMSSMPPVMPSQSDRLNNKPDLEGEEEESGGNTTTPTQANNHIEVTSNEENIPISVNAGDIDQKSMVPDMDMEEFDELLQRHGDIDQQSMVPDMDMEEFDELLQQHGSEGLMGEHKAEKI